MPTICSVSGRSPPTMPRTTGTTAPIEAIGATTPIVPDASAA